MNAHQGAALVARQQALLVRSMVLRSRLAADAAVLQRPLALLDRARQAWTWLRVHPEVPIAALVLVAVLRPRRAWRWGWRLWWGWRTLNRLPGWRVGAL